MRRVWISTLALGLALAACGDDKAKPIGDAGIDAAVDATPDAAPGRLTGCLDQPGTIPAAPNGQLPCDLVPPGLQL